MDSETNETIERIQLRLNHYFKEHYQLVSQTQNALDEMRVSLQIMDTAIGVLQERLGDIEQANHEKEMKEEENNAN